MYSFGTPMRRPFTPLSRSAVKSGTSSGADVESHGVVAADRVQHRRRVAHGARERPDLVQRAGERDEAVAADAPVRRLHADDAAERGGLADASARIGAQREDRLARRDGRRRAAGRAARHARQIPRVVRRVVGGVLRRRAHRELVHVRLADHHGARAEQPRRRPSRRTAARSSAASSSRRSSRRPPCTGHP